MNARDNILQRIRSTLAQEPEVPLLPLPVLWPEETETSHSDLVARLLEELQAVQVEGHICSSWEEAQRRLRELIDLLAPHNIGIIDHPLCRSATAALNPSHLAWVQHDWDPRRLAEFSIGILPAEFLLADTGTAVLLPRSPAERMLCYLPETAILVAAQQAIVAHMSDVWERISILVHDPSRRGEILFVTGPSRTGDIEKKLVLGAHGPRRLVVLVVGENSDGR